MSNVWFSKNLQVLQEEKIDWVNFFFCARWTISAQIAGEVQSYITGEKESIMESISWPW